MRIAYVTASMDTAWGGPVATVKALRTELARLGVEVVVYAPTGVRVGQPDRHEAWIRTSRVGALARIWAGYAPGLARTLIEEIGEFDIVHMHELWHYPHLAAFRAARIAGKPFIISPHGELGPWHMRHRATKKALFMWLIQRRILQQAAALHALTNQEKEDILRYVPSGQVAVIPNGVDPRPYTVLPPRSALENDFPAIRGKKVILFLGRLHRSKGVHLLARAFIGVARRRSDVALVLAGPDEGNLKPQLESLFDAAGVADRVVIPGLVTGELKLKVLGAATLFVLPSYAEGFSTAALEALAAGLPVVLTEACRFQEVVQHGAGLVVPTGDADALQQALNTILEREEDRSEMGLRGRRLVADRYTWQKVAVRMKELYEEVIENYKANKELNAYVAGTHSIAR